MSVRGKGGGRATALFHHRRCGRYCAMALFHHRSTAAARLCSVGCGTSTGSRNSYAGGTAPCCRNSYFDLRREFCEVGRNSSRSHAPRASTVATAAFCPPAFPFSSARATTSVARAPMQPSAFERDEPRLIERPQGAAAASSSATRRKLAASLQGPPTRTGRPPRARRAPRLARRCTCAAARADRCWRWRRSRRHS